MADVGIVPLYHQESIWATRKGVVYTPRADERTFAFEFRPQ
jgi:peptide/nickel transport system substrate-binding protein